MLYKKLVYDSGENMRTKEFPSKPLERIAKKSSKKRLSKQAAKALRTLILEKSEDKARETVEISRHVDRRTLLRRDIEFTAGKS
jgi:histone H3/H4